MSPQHHNNIYVSTVSSCFSFQIPRHCIQHRWAHSNSQHAMGLQSVRWADSNSQHAMGLQSVFAIDQLIQKVSANKLGRAFCIYSSERKLVVVNLGALDGDQVL